MVSEEADEEAARRCLPPAADHFEVTATRLSPQQAAQSSTASSENRARIAVDPEEHSGASGRPPPFRSAHVFLDEIDSSLTFKKPASLRSDGVHLQP